MGTKTFRKIIIVTTEKKNTLNYITGCEKRDCIHLK